jgi:hypothetical protein
MPTCYSATVCNISLGMANCKTINYSLQRSNLAWFSLIDSLVYQATKARFITKNDEATNLAMKDLGSYWVHFMRQYAGDDSNHLDYLSTC